MTESDDMADDQRSTNTDANLMAAVEAIVKAAEERYSITLSTPEPSPWKTAHRSTFTRTHESALGGWQSLGI